MSLKHNASRSTVTAITARKQKEEYALWGSRSALGPSERRPRASRVLGMTLEHRAGAVETPCPFWPKKPRASVGSTAGQALARLGGGSFKRAKIIARRWRSAATVGNYSRDL